MVRFFLSLLTILAVQPAFGQGCPNGICPPSIYPLGASGKTVDESLLKLQAFCESKKPIEIKDKKFTASLTKIQIEWNDVIGLYVEARCLIRDARDS